ncbi:hypothetical protein [Arthrobacter sp. RIT-PI-e]|uniref:hypothetical protein n=1 Tax=Arthrobacter sp. RIT-PI-e TaxID=1681197 RepID=UPI000B255508|nr:hypothetical protein [Arthrobacter sp. RIT-PI-e]
MLRKAKAALMALTIGVGSLGAVAVAPAPAQAAGIGHCTSLTLVDESWGAPNKYVAGSCTPPNPGPGAKLKLIVDCHIGATRNVNVTLNSGMSFKVAHGCVGGASHVTYSPT